MIFLGERSNNLRSQGSSLHFLLPRTRALEQLVGESQLEPDFTQVCWRTPFCVERPKLRYRDSSIPSDAQRRRGHEAACPLQRKLDFTLPPGCASF